MPKVRNIVMGQKIDPAKGERARALRREMTREERVLWQHLRGNRLGVHFRRQQVIDGFIVDFYCHQAGIVVEVDGGIHRARADYDRARERVLTARGLQVIRVRNDEVSANLEAVLDRISAACTDIRAPQHSRVPPPRE